MNRTLLATTALFAALALPAIAEAASGFATANVNMRSGPSTAYPAVTLIPVGQPLKINGCLSETPWCDVSFAGGRGWVAGKYVQAVYQQRRVYVGPDYYRPLGIPTITFDLDNYWDRNYRGRDFYRDRDRWAQGPDWDRNDGYQNPNRRPPPPRGSVYDGQDDGNQGNPPRRGNWPRQPDYNNGDDDSFQGNENAPRPPRYRRPYNDNGQQFDDNAPRQGDFRGDNNPPRMPPRQQGQDQQQGQGQPPRQQPQDQDQARPPRQQPQDQGQARPPRQQPQDQQQQPRPPQPAPQQQVQPQPQPAPPPRQQPPEAAPRPSNNQPAGGHGNLNAPGQNGNDQNCGNAPACGPQPHFSHN